MIIRRTYRIERWAEWGHEIHGFVQDFRRHFQVAPNLLLASEVTFARIDMAAAKGNIQNAEGEPALEGEYTPLSAFSGEDYELEFAMVTDLADREVSLIHDDDPDGGGEEVPDEDTPLPAEGTMEEATGA
jgi:hypothetical protein